MGKAWQSPFMLCDPTATRTVTVTASSVSAAGVPVSLYTQSHVSMELTLHKAAVTTSFTTDQASTTKTCTSTTISTVCEEGGGRRRRTNCGVPVSSYTFGSITCANVAPAVTAKSQPPTAIRAFGLSTLSPLAHSSSGYDRNSSH